MKWFDRWFSKKCKQAWEDAHNEPNEARGLAISGAKYATTASDGDFNASIVNTLQVERGDNFIAFESLTEQDVLGWVQSAVGKDVVEAALAAQIEAQKNPVKLNGLPW